MSPNRKPLFGLPAIAWHAEQGLKTHNAALQRRYDYIFFFLVLVFLAAFFFLAAMVTSCARVECTDVVACLQNSQQHYAPAP